MKPTAHSTVVVSSHGNRLGIEVRAELVEGRQMLRAYHLGELAAQREVVRSGSARVGKACEVLVVGASVELRAALQLALEEGVRALRDGRGLCEAA